MQPLFLHCCSLVSGFSNFSSLVLCDFLILEILDTGCNQLIVPGKEFAYVSSVNAVLVVVGKHGFK